jgi:succinate dehydrogenase / fumarate reductase iron-sulfur subunit
MPDEPVHIRIKRQATPDSQPYWEDFDVRWRSGMNVISTLMDIAATPMTRSGTATSPIVYESNCLEEVCGSCAMLINGKSAMACSRLLQTPGETVKLEPLSRFPVVRDLMVDRSVLFENLKRVKVWVPVDGTYDLGPGPRVPPAVQEQAYPLSRCISCCLCLEVCPQMTGETRFVGAAIINQVRLFNLHPTGRNPESGTTGRHDGRRRDSRVQFRPELCANLPEEYPADHFNFDRLWAGDEEGDTRPLPKVSEQSYSRPLRTTVLPV